MTEEQIERRVERAMDRLDGRLLSGELSQGEYDVLARDLDAWATAQYESAGYRNTLTRD